MTRRFFRRCTTRRMLLTLVFAPLTAFAELDLASWDALLREAVTDGHVDYRQWADNPRFDALVGQVARTSTDNMSREEKLVFYINAYNVLAATGILNGGSPGSFIGRFVYFKRDKYNVAGEEISLHQLEYERIRPLKEPRIHFAIVCASASCPILRSEAYTLQQLDQQLDSAAVDFINDRERNRFDTELARAEVSSIFKWFEEDFVESAGSLQAYLALFVDDEKSAGMLRAGVFDVEYLDYDWSLNGEL